MKKIPHIRLTYCLLLCVLCLPVGCIRTVVRLDLDTYLQQQSTYAGQEIVITAPLDDVLARYTLYEGKKNRSHGPGSLV